MSAQADNNMKGFSQSERIFAKRKDKIIETMKLKKEMIGENQYGMYRWHKQGYRLESIEDYSDMMPFYRLSKFEIERMLNEADRADYKQKTENWTRFCKDFKVKKVYNYVPELKFIGSRKYKAEEGFNDMVSENSVHFDHHFTIETESGEILIVCSNYNGNGEVDGCPDRIQFYVDEKEHLEYAVERTVLPREYRFYCLTDRRDDGYKYPFCNTVLWRRCVKKNFNVNK